MNRKQLEECAWKKTPKHERRATQVHTSVMKQKTTTRRLTGNNRQIQVFDPSGDTPGSVNPYVPLWSLYSDELQQRCEGDQQPKLRHPYHRTRRDYTSDVESSPMAARTTHATKKSSTDACLDVVFRVFPEGDVIAIFPGDATGRGFVNSYQHVGQHGEATPALIQELRQATPAEYAPLLAELKKIGYCLRIRAK